MQNITVASGEPLVIGAFEPFDVSLDLAFTNLPPEQDPPFVALHVASSRGLLAHLAIDSPVPAGGTTTTTFLGPTVPNGSLIIEGDFNRTGTLTTLQRRLFAWFPDTGGSKTYSIPETLLHPATGAPTYDGTAIRWTEDSSVGVDPDTVYGAFQTAQYRWMVVAPVNGTTLSLPRLPGALDQAAQPMSLITMKSTYDLKPHFFASDFDDSYAKGAEGMIVFQLFNVSGIGGTPN